MFFKLSKKSCVKSILVIGHSNIGDVLMSLPLLDVLRRDFPSARLSMIVGPRAMSLFEGNRYVKAIAFDKHLSWGKQIKWFLNLRRQSFDAVIDLRNTIIPFLLMPRYVTPLGFGGVFEGHLVDKHLMRLKQVYDFDGKRPQGSLIDISEADKRYVDDLLCPYVAHNEAFVVIAPVAADLAKTWNMQGFAKVADGLINERKMKVVILGAGVDKVLIDQINAPLNGKALDLSGKTNLVQVAEIVSRATLALVHDSGIMHIASYLNVPVVALFGPTNPDESAPWSDRWQVVQENKKCPRCLDRNKNMAHNCMSYIQPEHVLKAIDAVIARNNSDEANSIK